MECGFIQVTMNKYININYSIYKSPWVINTSPRMELIIHTTGRHTMHPYPQYARVSRLTWSQKYDAP